MGVKTFNFWFTIFWKSYSVKSSKFWVQSRTFREKHNETRQHQRSSSSTLVNRNYRTEIVYLTRTSHLVTLTHLNYFYGSKIKIYVIWAFHRRLNLGQQFYHMLSKGCAFVGTNMIVETATATTVLFSLFKTIKACPVLAHPESYISPLPTSAQFYLLFESCVYF